MKNTSGFIFIVLIAVVGLFVSLGVLFYLFVGGPNQMLGKNMEPAVKNKSYFFTLKLKSAIDNVKRNDIIIFASPKNSGIDYIKRIAGEPGDTILIQSGKILINGKEYADHAMSVTNTWEGGFSVDGIPVTVPADSYFVLGDDRLHSSDSREFGFIKKESIRGIYQFCFLNCQ